MPSPLRVALAGCHRQLDRKLSNHNWAAAFAAVPETNVVAIFDYGQQTRADFIACWGDLPAYDDYIAMLKDVQPDIVCIATRQTMHAEQCKQAAAVGVRGILSDKPLATSLTEADRIVAVCREHQIPLAFGLDRRWMANYQQLRQLIANGIVGDLTSIIAFGLPNLINHGCHWYDTLLMLSGDPEPIWVAGFVDDVSHDPSDSRRHMDPPGRGQIGLSNDTVAYITPAGGRGPAFEVIGQEGRLIILNDAKEAYLYTITDGTTQLQTVSLPSVSADWPAGPATVRDLIQAIQQGGQTACDVDQARRATEIGFAFHLSQAQNGVRIALPATERSSSIPSFLWGNEKNNAS